MWFYLAENRAIDCFDCLRTVRLNVCGVCEREKGTVQNLV